MISFKASAPIWEDGVKVLACMVDGEGRISHVASRLLWTMTEHKRGSVILEPTIDLTPDEARSLMTALWEAGIRPAGIGSPSAEIKRIEAHLEDMRSLVFKP